LGILNASSTKHESKDDDDDGDDPEPDISSYKLHSRTISTFCIPPTSPEHLYSSAYDGTIRRFDLNSGKSVELYVHPNEESLSAVQLLDASSQTLLFSTLNGDVGYYDTRAPSASAVIFACSEKKIGGLGIHPKASHIFATASLDRTVKIWDLRTVTGITKTPSERVATQIGEHSSALSVSSACFNSCGSLATASYDNTIKIYQFPKATAWTLGHTESKETMKPSAVIPHNNQTGRWVTILRAVWQDNPLDGMQKLVVGNMNRSIDIFSDSGEQLAQLGDLERISAVPAAARLHPVREWVAGGTGSGKIVLFM
jgi:WD40 repeat protein